MARDHAHVDRDGVGGADRPDVVFLEHAQQLDLQAHGHVADLVEQQRAAIGGLEQALVIAYCAGERSFDVAEQLRLEQVFGHRAAVDGDERLGAARAGVVDGARQQFLAGAAFAGDEDARVGARDHVRLRELLLDQRAAGDDFSAPVFIVVGESGNAQRLLYLVQQLLFVDRLGQEAEGAELGGMHGIGNGAVGREDDDLEPGIPRLQFLEQPDAVHLVHAQVGDDQLGAEAAGGCERERRAFHGLHFVILRTEADGQQAKQARIVVDDQDAGFALGGMRCG